MAVEQSSVADFIEDCKSYVQYETSDYRRASSNFAPRDTAEVVSLFESDARAKIKDPCGAGFDTLVLDWYVRLLHPSQFYLEHLDYFRDHDRDSRSPEYRASGFINGFYFYKHHRKAETWAAVPDVVCDPYNPCAKFKSIRSSASRTYSQLKNLEGCSNIIFLDLTFPKEISNLLFGSNQSPVIGKAHSCVARFIELLRGNLEAHLNEHKSPVRRQSIPSDATLAHQYNPHLWKTSEPTSPHLHVHLDLLWAFRDGDKLHPLKFHEKGVPLGADFVRLIWKQAVSEVFGYDYGDRDADVHIAWAPLSWGVKVLHRLKYRRRKPITDLGEYYLDHDFDPDSFDDGFNKFLLHYSNKSYSHGFWTSLVKFLRGHPGKNSANVKICPICGERVAEKVYVPFERATFDRVVLLDRHGSAYLVKPPPHPSVTEK